jgi:hypothetical protein
MRSSSRESASAKSPSGSRALFHHHHEVGVRALDGIAQNSDELRVRKTAVDAFRRSRNVHGRVGSLTGRLGVIRAVEKRFVIV